MCREDVAASNIIHVRDRTGELSKSWSGFLFDSLSGKHNSDSGLENVESNFNSLMARAQDLEKEINVKVEQQGRKRKREVEVWFEDVKNVEGEYHAFKKEEKGLINQIFGGDEALKLNARIRDLDNRSRLFGELVLADDTIRGLPRPTTELEGAAFQDNFQRILNLLENEQMSSIGVHGMGGVGKSTLVEHIHNHLLEINKCVLWVVVSSQRCSVKMLQDKIARKLRLDLSDDDDDEGARSARLNHALSQRKNFVLILDDVWERIDLVRVGVPLSMEGCKWMMTSRSLNLCREMNCQKKIVVKPLSKDEGWNLFLKNLGQDTRSTIRDPEVEVIGKRMVEICDGLPLGIITLAGAVSGLTEIHEWRHELGVLEESAMGHEWMEEKVFRVLKYSFDRLNRNDQCCFLYCSLYPEDFRILREELVKKIISEKLVDEKKSRAAQRDEARSRVSRLVKVSLLESTVSDHCVKMHDLVRGMAHKITKGKTMVITGRKEIPVEEEWTEHLEKVSLMLNGIAEIPHGISPNCPKLTTLILRENPLKRLATSFFTRMRGLCTLDLSHTQIEELPDSMSELVNLTSLLLGRCRKLGHVPCVRKLKELRELDLSYTSIKDVPQGVEELVNIRVLSMHRATKLLTTSLVLKSPRLQLLRLPHHIEAELVEGCERLEVFTGRLNHMSNFTRLVATKQDAEYSIVVCGKGCRYLCSGGYDDGQRRLTVYRYDLKDREENHGPVILADYIQYLEFHFCKGMSKCLLDDLTNLSSLKRLKIKKSRGIECLLTYDQFKAPQDSKSRLQAVEQIELRKLDDFTGVIQKLEIEADPPPSSAFSSLRRLSISRCNKMKKLGLPLSVFEKLEHITVKDCEEIEEIVQVAVAADAAIIALPNLKSLNLDKLPSLESFCSATMICNLLEHFRLENCPRLRLPFLNRGTPDSYKPLFPLTKREVITRSTPGSPYSYDDSFPEREDIRRLRF